MRKQKFMKLNEYANDSIILSIDRRGDTGIPCSALAVAKACKEIAVVIGNSDDSKFSSHRWGRCFIYKITVPKNTMYAVVLSFAEIYELSVNPANVSCQHPFTRMPNLKLMFGKVLQILMSLTISDVKQHIFSILILLRLVIPIY